MGIFNFLFGGGEDRRKRDIEDMEDDLIHLYGYSKKRLAKMSDEEKEDLWYEEDGDCDD